MPPHPPKGKQEAELIAKRINTDVEKVKGIGGCLYKIIKTSVGSEGNMVELNKIEISYCPQSLLTKIKEAK